MAMSSRELKAIYKKLEDIGVCIGFKAQITKQQFLSAFEQISDLPPFSWLLKLLDGIKIKNLNVEESEAKPNEERRLTVESITKMRSMIKKNTSLSDDELTLIKQFYDREIMSRDGKYVLKVLNKMFRNIENTVLR